MLKGRGCLRRGSARRDLNTAARKPRGDLEEQGVWAGKTIVHEL